MLSAVLVLSWRITLTGTAVVCVGSLMSTIRLVAIESAKFVSLKAFSCYTVSITEFYCNDLELEFGC